MLIVALYSLFQLEPVRMGTANPFWVHLIWTLREYWPNRSNELSVDIICSASIFRASVCQHFADSWTYNILHIYQVQTSSWNHHQLPASPSSSSPSSLHSTSLHNMCYKLIMQYQRVDCNCFIEEMTTVDPRVRDCSNPECHHSYLHVGCRSKRPCNTYPFDKPVVVTHQTRIYHWCKVHGVELRRMCFLMHHPQFKSNNVPSSSVNRARQ
jgi:hypothetical protein